MLNGVQFEDAYISQMGDTRTIGTGEVIRCWDETLIGIRLGSRVQVICPPHKWSNNFKDSSYVLIEPDSVLIYEISLNEH